MRALALAAAAFAGAVLTVGMPAAATPKPERAALERVIDGDTIELVGGRRVRVVGIDTPEKNECGFFTATFWMTQGLYEGTPMRLALIRPSASYDNRDRYGRLLRYVQSGGRDVGYQLVLAGFAESYDRYPHPRLARYEAAEANARSKDLGLWKECGHP